MLAGKLFLIGRTKSGKTTLAARLAAELGLVHVAASAWAREGFGETGAGEEFTRRITAWSLGRLRADPDACIRFVRARFRLEEGGHVIEGVRNPRDLVGLHDPRRDAVAFLDNERAPAAVTPFEQGVEVIAAYVRWLEDTGLAPARSVRIAWADAEPADAPLGRLRAFVEGLT